jgi:tetratricopeptide (TPR) repeat protein
MKRLVLFIPLLAFSCSFFSSDIFDESFISKRKKDATKEEVTRSYGLFNAGFNLAKDPRKKDDAEKSIIEAIRLYPAPSYYEELGNLYFEKADYSKSLKSYKLAISLTKEAKPFLFYNAACAASMSKNTGEGFHLLEQALAAGYSNFTKLKTDPDLENIRSVAEFKTLVDRYRR